MSTKHFKKFAISGILFELDYNYDDKKIETTLWQELWTNEDQNIFIHKWNREIKFEDLKKPLELHEKIRSMMLKYKDVITENDEIFLLSTMDRILSELSGFDKKDVEDFNKMYNVLQSRRIK